ncbi:MULTISPECIES: Zn-dependent hydrolase [Terrilactibacillus]|uniref:Hydantoinase/carbamoylase family amidase n=2 Tax=Terrilactibacillus TaxID=1795633 RepID=A0A6N8CU68_9BACI|nr:MULTISPECIES: Zn-dependent hydrolase [Terrilactibacillus]MTT32827.1 hydantoinase/carbamoylase family amidase [Terrilactibacillus tamarindi]
MINEERLWEHLEALSTIGKQETGGITRLSFSEEERQAKDLVSSWMKDAGLTVREDEVGNLIGRKEGLDPHLPVILVGSHIDSVYHGGNFDGPLGVLSGIEALQAMNEQGMETQHPIEVVAFTDEEGSRFSLGMIGSRGMAGTLTKEHLEQVDKNGISVAEAMSKSGLDPEEIQHARREKDSIKAYLELHIEQGKILESKNLSVGIVSGIAGPIWQKFIINGEAGHAGTTPMTMRRDPLTAASAIIQVINKEASKTGTTVGTVGQLELVPGGINVIPERVEFSLDLRDISEEVRDHVELEIATQAKSICEQYGVELIIEPLQRVAPAPCSDLVQTCTKAACDKLNIETMTLSSGAGHDGMQLTELCPIGMIFVRSKNGISHNPAEWSSMEDCKNGANVLCQTILNLDLK